MTTIEGQLFDGSIPIALPAQMHFAEGCARLTTEALSKDFASSDLKVSPRIAAAQRFVALPEGRQFVCADQPLLDILPQESPEEGLVAWLENRWQVALAGVVLIALILLAGYFWGLPVLARHLVGKMPMKTELALGRQALTWFDHEGWLKPSRADQNQCREIYFGFIRLFADLPFKYFYKLEFRASTVFGPNAFALPGGIIVVTDDLVKLSQSTDEVLAVLAHEIAHVELRHAMRSILQNSIVGATLAAVTSDAATLSAAVAGLPVLLAQTKYSRKFESAADDYAFKLMTRKGISPNAFAALMERLAAKRGGITSSFGFDYFSTHPAIEERVRRAREAAAAKGASL
jgi:Zn-dependent protease with chaperone function